MIALNNHLHYHKLINKKLNVYSVIKYKDGYNHCKLLINGKDYAIYFYDKILNKDIEKLLQNGYLFCLPKNTTKEELEILAEYTSFFETVVNLHNSYIDVRSNHNDKFIIPKKSELISAIEKVLDIIDKIFGLGLGERGCSLEWKGNFTENINTPEIKPDEEYNDGPVPVPRPR